MKNKFAVIILSTLTLLIVMGVTRATAIKSILPALTSFETKNTSVVGNLVSGTPFVGAPQSANASPYILNITDSAKPGETIDIQGDLANITTLYLQPVAGVDTLPINLNILSQSPNVILAQIPMIPNNVWWVWVKNNLGNISNKAVINAAGPARLNWDRLSVGANFEVYGRKMVLPNYPAQVKFTNNVTNISEVVNATGGNLFELDATAPTDLDPSASYTISVNNGLAASSSAMFIPVPVSITIQAAGPDGFGLGPDVPWAVDYTFYNNVYNVMSDPRLSKYAVGDGVTDDSAAVSAAILKANQAGGGVVYLPAGTYNFVNTVALQSNVVVKGAGESLTLINFGSTGKPAMSTPNNGGSVLGIMDLTLTSDPNSYRKYLNTGGGEVLNIKNNGTVIQQDIFLKDMAINYGNGNYSAIEAPGGYKNFLIDGVTLHSTAGGGGLYIVNSSYVTITNTTAVYQNGRVLGNGDDNATLKYDHFTSDESFMITDNDTQCGGPQISYGLANVVMNTTIDSIGNEAKTANQDCGEAINIEDSYLPTQMNRFSGTLTGVSGSAFTDSTANWPVPISTWPPSAQYPAVPPEPTWIYFLSGPALGEKCKITSNTTNSVVCNGANLPISVPVGTQYGVVHEAGDNDIVAYNTIYKDPKEVLIWGGCYNCTISDNNFTDTSFAGWGWNITPGPGTTAIAQYVRVLENLYVENNNFTNVDGLSMYGDTAMIVVGEKENNPNTIGIVDLNGMVRNNNIVSDIPCSGFPEVSLANQWSVYATPWVNGCGVFVGHTLGGNSKFDYDKAGMLGILVEGNTFKGITGNDVAYSPDVDQLAVDKTTTTVAKIDAPVAAPTAKIAPVVVGAVSAVKSVSISSGSSRTQLLKLAN